MTRRRCPAARLIAAELAADMALARARCIGSGSPCLPACFSLRRAVSAFVENGQRMIAL